MKNVSNEMEEQSIIISVPYIRHRENDCGAVTRLAIVNKCVRTQSKTQRPRLQQILRCSKAKSISGASDAESDIHSLFQLSHWERPAFESGTFPAKGKLV